ncbi:TonB family protein [uncultured Roseibium sp.]|uniref:energy transducer TonB family protein n=1 Tax=uncultured Roseibium sp. TaxID=1936171 RepID=UPI002630B2C3|nr:TonB family protein [uncultured Roseibium sp.]
MKSIHRPFFIAVFLSLVVHVIAAALTMKDAQVLEHAGGGALQHAVLGEAAFNTIVSGSVEQLAITVPVDATATRHPVKSAKNKTARVESRTPSKSKVTTPVDPIVPAVVVPSPQTAVSLPTSQAKALAVTSRALTPVEIAKTVSSQTQTPARDTKQVSKITPAPHIPLEPSQARPIQVLPQAANTQSVAIDPMPAKKQTAIEAENAPIVERSEATPSPRVKPRPTNREVVKTISKKPEKQAQKPQTASRNGAGGSSSRTAQKGGSQRKGKAKSAGNADTTNYPAKVHRKLLRSVRAPRGGRRAQSDAVVRFTVQKNGAVTGIQLAKSSGSKPFDTAVVKAVQRAAPFPPIPGSRASWSFTLPVAMR